MLKRILCRWILLPAYCDHRLVIGRFDESAMSALHQYFIPIIFFVKPFFSETKKGASGKISLSTPCV